MFADVTNGRTIGSADLADLAAQIDGPVLSGADPGFAEEIATWNQARIQHPIAAIGATSVSDVQAAVRFAHRNDLPVAVVATGHGATISADGAVLINLRRMNSISIDAETRTATVGAAVVAQSLVDAATAEGLAPLAGSSPNVGVVGYTLGGGLSPALGRRYGYAADHVRSADIVTADGELHHVDAGTEPDLFWAIRGGKSNFGVVTTLTVDLVPVTGLYGGGLFFTGEHVVAVLAAYRRLVAQAPRELTASFAFLRLPPLPFVPEPLRGRFTLHVRIAYLGSADEGERLVADLRAAAPALIDAVGELPFTEFAAIHADPVDPLPVYEMSAMLRDFPAEAAEALIAVAGPAVTTPALMLEIRQLGGALAEQPESANAVGNRDAGFQLFVAAVGPPELHETFRAPLDALVDALSPWSTGRTQINFLTDYDATAEGVARAYAPETFERLTRIKQAYDPRNLFRINHNIPPRP